MMMTVKKYLLSSALMIGSCAFTSHANAQSIQAAVQAAIANNPQIEQASAREGAAKEEISAARSGFFPTLSVGLTAGRMYADNATSRGTLTTRGAAYSGVGEANASLRQPIFDGFETLNRLRSSKAGVQAANLELQDTREQIAYQTVQAYLNVLQARSILIRLQNQETKVDSYLGRIKTNVDDGGADESQYQQARDVRVLLSGFVADYTGQLRAAESQYIALTGTPPLADMSVPSLDVSGVPVTLEDALASARLDHPAIRARQADAKAADFDIDAEKALLYPDVIGELSYLKSDKKEEIGGELEDRRAVLRLNWDMETGGGQYARIKQRKYQHAEMIAREKEMTNQIERDIRIAYADRQAAQKRLANQRERVELNQKLFDTYEAQFEGGRVDLLQLMQADNQLLNTQIENIIYQYRFLAARYGVVASIGKLQEALFQTAALEAMPTKSAVITDTHVSADEPQE
ncbi:MAG: TolC family protein [Alphaproteobacteria bacterium]|nr:TolC family protein [Alphaproteobacteria bacterium]